MGKKKKPKEKVLIIDDDPEINRLLSFVLRQENYDTIWAENGEKGLEMIESEGPDIVLLDLVMDKMDGMEVLERALKTNPELPIIMITAHGSERAAVQLLKSGAIDYICKPFNSVEIVFKTREGLKKAQIKAVEGRFFKRMAETTCELVHQMEQAEMETRLEIEAGMKRILQVMTDLITQALRQQRKQS